MYFIYFSFLFLSLARFARWTNLSLHAIRGGAKVHVREAQEVVHGEEAETIMSAIVPATAGNQTPICYTTF